MKQKERKPDFSNILKILRHEVPDRPTIFEFAICGDYLKRNADPGLKEDWTDFGINAYLISAQRNLGYDYCCGMGSDFGFPGPNRDKGTSVGMAHGGLVIKDRAALHALPWTDPADCDYSRLDRANLPDGMGMILRSPGGVLEALVRMFGFEELCYHLADEPELIEDAVEMIGSRMVRYFEICASHPKTDVLLHSDDWGFKSSISLSPAQLREYIMPWHGKIVETCHRYGKPVILHSCGKLDAVMDDIIAMGYDAKHSFEDAGTPVEEALARWGARIPILGGIDMDFLCRRTPEEIKARARKLLEMTAATGGYALGSGNSIAGYMPYENYIAMNQVALEA